MKNEFLELAIPFSIFTEYFTFTYIVDPSMEQTLLHIAILILTVLIVALTLDRFIEKFRQTEI